MQDRPSLHDDQLRLVLQPDDQLVKITTVIAIDDHSDGEHAAYDKTAKHTGVFPHSSTATASPDRTGEGEGTAVLAIVTIKHELLKFPGEPVGPRNQSLHDPSGMTQCVIVRVRLFEDPTEQAFPVIFECGLRARPLCVTTRSQRTSFARQLMAVTTSSSRAPLDGGR